MNATHNEFIRLQLTENACVLGDPAEGRIGVLLGKRTNKDGSVYHGIVAASEFVGMFLGTAPGMLDFSAGVVQGGVEIDVSCRRAYVKKYNARHVEIGLNVDGGNLSSDLTFNEEDEQETADESAGDVTLRVQLDRGQGEPTRFSKDLSEPQCWEIVHACHEMAKRLARLRADEVHGYASDRALAAAPKHAERNDNVVRLPVRAPECHPAALLLEAAE